MFSKVQDEKAFSGRVLFDAMGRSIAQYYPVTEPLGNTQRTPYLFTAKELDEETGLYYFGARYYDPRVSVWQSPDRILDQYLPDAQRRNGAVLQKQTASAFLPPLPVHLPSGGDDEALMGLQGLGGVFNSYNLSLYAYSYQNPIRYVDPDGNAGRMTGLELFKQSARGLAYMTSDFVSHGYTPVASEIYFKADSGEVIRIDGAFKGSDGRVVFGEAKIGNTAEMTKNQKAAFEQLHQGKGVFYGKNAGALADALDIKPDAQGRFKIEADKIQGVSVRTYERSTEPSKAMKKINGELFRGAPIPPIRAPGQE